MKKLLLLLLLGTILACTTEPISDNCEVYSAKIMEEYYPAIREITNTDYPDWEALDELLSERDEKIAEYCER